MASGLIVPPGGFAGFNQMTPASRGALLAPGRGGGGGRRRRRKTAKKATRRRASGKKRSGGKLKFGSPAWQRKYKVGRFAKKR